VISKTIDKETSTTTVVWKAK